MGEYLYICGLNIFFILNFGCKIEIRFYDKFWYIL